MNNIRILSTKKLLPNQKQFLLNAGFSVVDADFISTRPIAFDAARVSGNLIFTSRNAVESVLENPDWMVFKDYPVFCVGAKTQELLEASGFTVVASSDYATELVDDIRVRRSEPFTFFCGNLRLDTLPMSMKVAGIPFTEIQVYETTLAPVHIAGDVDGILFFSPSGVKSYLEANTLTDQMCFCIGTTTAAALQPITNRIVVANRPSVENVIIQCINHFETPPATEVTFHLN